MIRYRRWQYCCFRRSAGFCFGHDGDETTIGKKGYEASEEVMQHAQTLTTRFQKEFVALIDKDSKPMMKFLPVLNFPKLPMKKSCPQRCHSGSHQACRPHSDGSCPKGGSDARQADIARLGNRNAITDACVAMMAARSAALGALLNVPLI